MLRPPEDEDSNACLLRAEPHTAHLLLELPSLRTAIGGGVGTEAFALALHDLAPPPTAQQLAQGGFVPYVDDTYFSPSFTANPLADFADTDTSNGITPALSAQPVFPASADALVGEYTPAVVARFPLIDLVGSVLAWTDSTGASTITGSFDPTPPSGFCTGRVLSFGGS